MDPISGLSLGRIGIGALALVRPDLSGRLFGLDVEANPQLPFMTRMFASREIVVGAATLLARDTLRRRLVVAGIGIDAADAFGGYVGGRDGSLSKRSGTVMVVVPVGAVLAGAATLVAERCERRERRVRGRADRRAVRLGVG